MDVSVREQEVNQLAICVSTLCD